MITTLLKMYYYFQRRSKLSDKNKNRFKFSQIFIDEKKKEIIDADAKLFLKAKNFKRT